ncbi:MAG: AbrB family transcriptional regulator [Fischerella sp. CENA71]|nr:AbrB family transcriptional regulator [Fischerella sp. CENA71]
MNQSLTVVPHQEHSTTENPIVKQQQVSIKQLIILSLELLLAIPFGLALSHFNFGGIAWIFGGIISGALVFQTCRVFYNYSPKPNRAARQVGMMLVGITIGASNAHANLANITPGVPVFVFLTLFLMICGGCIGYIYSRLSKTNLLTSMLATVPGGVGVMSAIAADYNKNVTLVALVQALRVTSVVFLIPLIARVTNHTSNQPQISPTNQPYSLELLLLVLFISTLAVYIAKFLKVPAAPFFASLLVGITFNPILNYLPLGSDIYFTPPLLIKLLGQMLLGITIGEYWGEKPTFQKRTIGYALISVAMTLAAGVAATLLAMQLTSWDWLTCLLVTAPGGAAEIILVALTLDHNVEIVTAGHVIRLIAINSFLPIWLFLFRYFENKEDRRETV